MRVANLVTSVVLAFWASLAAAGDTGLKSLETSADGRGWEAVGRIDIADAGFCTGALIAPDLVLTAAHCLFDKQSGARVEISDIEFMAGWRNGRATAYRAARRAVVHPDYVFSDAVSTDAVRNDVALVELARPIRLPAVQPFGTAPRPRKGEAIGVVSYARDRAEAPALQEVCSVMARQSGVLVMSCNVDFGSSGAPVFSFDGAVPQIVSVISAKANVNGQRVSLGTSLMKPLDLLKAELAQGGGFGQGPAPRTNRIRVPNMRRDTGAKFIKP